MNELKLELRRPIVVLLVEKDVILNFFICEFLEAAGFKVLDVATTEEALVALQTHSDINAVIVDYARAGPNTDITLAQSVAMQFPRMALFVIIDKTLTLTELPPRVKILAKPFEPEMVSAFIRRAVDEASQEQEPVLTFGNDPKNVCATTFPNKLFRSWPGQRKPYRE